MNWERFHYICRRTLKELSDDENVNECISRVERTSGCDCYGRSGDENSIAQSLLKKIKNKPERSEAIRALEIYGKMDLSTLLTEPMHFKRVVIYLAIVIFVFIGVSGIYHFIVAPAFLDAFESFELSIPSQLVFYQDYWMFFVLIIFFMMALSLFIGQSLTKLLAFKVNQLDTFIVRFFVLKQIKSSYILILEAISYPISVETTQTSHHEGHINEHLREVEKIGMDLATEMYSIIELERKKLVTNSEKQMRILSVIIAIAVISVIFNFVASAYSPIFVLGEIM